MIVISTISSDDTSSNVIEWLSGEEVNRINNDDVQAYFSESKFNLLISESSSCIKSIWFRKGGRSELKLKNVGPDVIAHATEEMYALSRYFYHRSKRTIMLGTTESMILNKLALLRVFKDHMLEIPPSLVTNQKVVLQKFLDEHIEVIIKPIGEGSRFNIDGEFYKIYTEKLDREIAEQLSDSFFPTLFQKCIKKKYEIRAFYLNGAIYSMALFTSRHENTNVDHRSYRQYNAIRSVPYKLPVGIEEKLRAFMTFLNLDTGSFDIIRGIDDKYYFLEINPAGEFGELSHTCNYYLEKKIADYLKNGKSI